MVPYDLLGGPAVAEGYGTDGYGAFNSEQEWLLLPGSYGVELIIFENEPCFIAAYVDLSMIYPIGSIDRSASAWLPLRFACVP